MPRLLVVHHSPTAGLRALLDAVVAGTSADGIEGVEVAVVAALEPDATDVVAADGYLLGTPANLGYMSGALKHFFDIVYNEALGVTAGRPYALWVHGESDTTGAISGVERIITGLRWRAVAAPLSIVGDIGAAELASGWELGATTAAHLMPS